MTLFQTYKEVTDFINKNNVALFTIGDENNFSCNLSLDIFNAFTKNNINFAYFNVANDPDAIDCLKKLTPFVSIPFLFISGKPFGGYEEIRSSLFSGELFDSISELN